MSVDYSIPAKAAQLQAVANLIDAGGGNGMLRLLDLGGNILSSLPLARPCATVFGNLLTFSGMSLIDTAAAAGGAAQRARCEDSTGIVVISGLTVGPGGTTADILLSPTNTIAAGQVVAITAATITGN